MRVLLANKFYYPRGGDCVAMLNTERALRQRGHEVAVFAMQHPLNLESPWSKYWPSEVSFDGPLSSKLKAASRILGGNGVAEAFTLLLNDFKPEVVHLHNIHSQLSPVLAQLAHNHGCRVVWTMHDYKLLCPAYSCLDGSGRVCEQCMTGSKCNVVKKRCMKGSLAASLAAWLEAVKWPLSSLMQWTDAVICPSQFMARMMIKAGLDKSKISVVPNFTNTTPEVVACRDNYYCYVGRLSQEKGITRLLEVAQHLPYQLKVAGTGPLEAELREKYGSNENIEFLGQLTPHEVSQLLQQARVTVMPSMWYENNPLAAIESLCAGTPVVGTNMGGIPELINDSNGIVTPIEHLGEAITQAMATPWNHDGIAAAAHCIYNEERYMAQLIEAYTK